MDFKYRINSYNDYSEQLEKIMLENDVNSCLVLHRGEIYPIIHIASILGTIEQVEKLIEKGASINQKTYWGNALHQALRFDRPDIGLYLINKGIDINAEDVQGFTALIHACSNGYEDIVDILLEKGVQVNVHGGHDRTALNRALENSYNSIAKKLIDKGAYVDGDNRAYGWIPLTYCVRKNNKEMYEYLLKRGADPDYKDLKGNGESANELRVKLNRDF
jgi:ankyrin repeat protein